MKPFIFQNWHAWESVGGVLLSDETAKNLWEFKSIDSCITWLFVAGFKDCARALHAHQRG